MNHMPFRDWLLSGEKLSDEHNMLLQEHLQSCAECKQAEIAWSEVESTIHRASQIGPQPGFTARWQAHLVVYQQQKQKRAGWISIGVIAIIILSLLGFSISQIWIQLQSPGVYLASIFSRLISIFSVYYTLRELVNPISFGSPLIAFISLFFLTGIISFMSVLWLATFRKLSLARRIA